MGAGARSHRLELQRLELRLGGAVGFIERGDFPLGLVGGRIVLASQSPGRGVVSGLAGIARDLHQPCALRVVLGASPGCRLARRLQGSLRVIRHRRGVECRLAGVRSGDGGLEGAVDGNALDAPLLQFVSEEFHRVSVVRVRGARHRRSPVSFGPKPLFI